MSTYVGIDLALPGKRRIGYASINAELRIYSVKTLTHEEEILSEVLLDMPRAICIDSPLSLPKEGINRLIEIRARKMGLRLLPPLMGAMKELTLFGMKLAGKLRGMGFTVLEVHPTSTLKILGLGRDEFLRRIKLKPINGTPQNKHEIDALIASYTCYLHSINCIETITGYEGEGELIIPKRGCHGELLV